MDLFDRDRSAEMLPVSLVTGFLGSGKTTLLNRLLKHAEMAGSLVIVNEFGEIGLDHLLFERIDGETVLMSSGCVCCTVRGDLEATLKDITRKRAAGLLPTVDRILVETTGLADPAPIVQLLLNNPLTSHDYRLDAVVTTVDAANGEKQLDEHREAIKQAALADRLLLTKTDIAAADAALRLRLRLGLLNPTAELIDVRQGDVEPARLFGADLFDPARKTTDVRRWLRDDAADASPHAHGPGPRGDGVASFSITETEPLDWQRVHDWLAALRRECGTDLLRVKAILNLGGEDRPVVLHGIHHVFHPPVTLERWPDGDPRTSRIVFIVRDLDSTMIRESWRAFVAGRAAA